MSSIKKTRKRTLHWDPIEEDVAGTVWAKAAALEEIAPTIPKVGLFRSNDAKPMLRRNCNNAIILAQNCSDWKTKC